MPVWPQKNSQHTADHHFSWLLLYRLHFSLFTSDLHGHSRIGNCAELSILSRCHLIKWLISKSDSGLFFLNYLIAKCHSRFHRLEWTKYKAAWVGIHEIRTNFSFNSLVTCQSGTIRILNFHTFDWWGGLSKVKMTKFSMTVNNWFLKHWNCALATQSIAQVIFLKWVWTQW